MATETETQATDRGWKPYRLSVEQFSAMVGAGIFPDETRVELLGGMLVERMTRHAPHNYCVIVLGRLLNRLLPAEWFVGEEKPVDLGRRWRPEPDLAVIMGPPALFRDRTPVPSEIGLLIEVSDSSYALDRGVKWRGYAAARVPIYWIVNFSKRQVEVYRDPSGRGRSAGYRRADTFGIDAEAPVVIAGRELGRVIVRDILP